MRSAFDPEAATELRRRLDGFRPDAERRWGTMTPHEAVVHMTDLFRMALGERPLPDKSSWFSRTLMRWVGLHTPIPWPRGIRAPREVDQAREGTPPESWDRDLEALRGALDRFVDDPEALDGNVHAVLGPLTRREWGVWGYRHTDHHLRQFGL